MSSSTHNGQPIFRLRDVLAALLLPPSINLEGLSEKWRCVVMPRCKEDGGDEYSSLESLDKGVPCHLSVVRADAVHKQCGQDGIEFFTDPKWNVFEKPQIAVKYGWGRPGTTLESSRFHTLIESFKDVFEHTHAVEVPLTEEERKEARDAAKEDDDVDVLEKKEAQGEVDESTTMPPLRPDDVVELQLFHREEGTKLPILGASLLWPEYLEDSILCDTATIASQRGSLRWWHLNDSGEFTFYTALPSKEAPPVFEVADKKLAAVLKDAPGPLAKVFLYGPKGGYDWFIHDAESNVCHKVVCLDIFNTPDEALPKDETLLPILNVGLLFCGGQPILVPPNIPTLSITVHDSVLVEQRRVSSLWLEEISYYLHRVSNWRTTPILYDYLETDLQDETIVASQLIPTLLHLFRSHDGGSLLDGIIRKRVAVSLYAIGCHEKHYKLPEGSRESLVKLLKEGEDGAFRQILATPYAGCDTLEMFLMAYWNTEKYWPKSGCVFTPPLHVQPSRLYSDGVRGCESWFIPVVYCNYLPVYGSEQKSLEDTVTEYFEMKDVEQKRKELLTLLRSRKTDGTRYWTSCFKYV
ncbi:hypothetical protein AGDE_06795 [Angomonas deanei]|nr:hypothetical protein AGDE_06795 [Angomonas deanei]|eukprot:EPY36682.1 hypothetical protein AGDE_06795 [Angomonas deanei]